MDRVARRQALARRLDALGVDAFLSTSLPNVRYLSGYSGSNGQVLVAAEGDRFFTDGRYIEQSRLEVPDMERVIYGGALSLSSVLKEALKSLGVSRVGFESAHMTVDSAERLRVSVGELVPCADEVGRLRWVKDDEELAMIVEAQRVSDEALAVILPTLVESETERRVATRLERCMIDLGAEGLAFDTIVAFGEQAAEPHHQPNDRALQRGDIVKVDFGARWEGYHADMTRTVAFGDPGSHMKDVYEVVRRSQQAGIEAVRAGARGMDVDAVSRGVISEAGLGDSFTHGLGHGVGLEIHEGPTLAATIEEEIPAGAVVTVEPGIYLPGEGGVRIEDMVVVTADGCRVLPTTGKELVIL